MTYPMRALLLAAVSVAAATAAAAIAVVIEARTEAQTEAVSARTVDAGLTALIQGELDNGLVTGSATTFIDLKREAFTSMWLRIKDPCVISAGQVAPAEDEPRDLEWAIDAQLLSATEDAAAVDLRWRRIVHRAGGAAGSRSAFAANESLEERRRVRLQHGQWVTLDLVRAAPTEDAADGGDPPRCRRIVVTITFTLRHPPDVRDAGLRYDMWLVHREATGMTATERVQSAGKQDATVEYLFTPLHHGPTGMPATEQERERGAFATEISGTLRGRARSDGLVDLTLTTWRRIYAPNARRGANLWTLQMWADGSVIHERDSRGIVGNGGSKQMTVRPGETIEVGLPPASGRLDDTHDLARVFAGQSTALRLTTSRVR